MFRYELLLKTERSKCCDMQFFGFVNLYSKERKIFSIGDDNHQAFFLRSLAKPFQASIGSDFKTPDFYNFTEEENAITTSSHTGEEIHTNLVKSVLNKAGLDETYLKCQTHASIGRHNNTEPVNNNCSGKHALMLAICKQNGWDTSNYLDFSHPLQKKIFEKQKELFETDNLIPSLDGCNAPVYAAPFDNIAKGFFNLFNDKKYDYIKNAFLNHPFIIGGYQRTDTKIIEKGKGHLIAKVGAGGFLGIFNVNENKFLLIKMAQDNNLQREILAQKLLRKLNWIEDDLTDEYIYSNNKTKVAKYELAFKF